MDKKQRDRIKKIREIFKDPHLSADDISRALDITIEEASNLIALYICGPRRRR